MRCTKSILGVSDDKPNEHITSSSNPKIYGALTSNFIAKLSTPLGNFAAGFFIQGFVKVDGNTHNVDMKASIENNLVSISGLQEGNEFIKIVPGPGHIEIRGFASQLSLEIRLFPLYGFTSYEWSFNPLLKNF